MSALREVLVAFGFEVDNAPLKKAHGEVSDFVSTLTHFAKIAAGAFAIHEVGHFVGEMIEAGREVHDTAERLGVTTDALEKFEYAAKLSGVSSEAAAHALQFLNKNVGEAIGGNADAAKTMAELGINLNDVKSGAVSATDLLPQLADKFASAGSAAEQTAIAMKIFGRSGAALIPMLKGGSAELKKTLEQFDKLGLGFDKDFIDDADKAGDNIDTFKFALRGLGSQLVVAILPTIAEWAMRLAEGVAWIRKISKESNIVTVVLATLAVVAGVLAIVWLALNAELVLTALAIAALILIIEDIYTLFTGGRSVIGDFIDSLFGVGASAEFVREVKDAANEIYDAFVTLWPLVKGIGGLIATVFAAAWPAVKAFWKNAIQAQLEWFKFAVAVIQVVTNVLGALFQTTADVINQQLAAAGLVGLDADNPLTKFSEGLAKSGALLQLAANPDPEASPSDLGQYRTGAPRNVDIAQSNKIDITVQGGPTNADTGRTVAGAVKGVLTQSDLNAAKAALRTTAPDE